MNEGRGGYDVEFVNDLQKRHECPLCLLGLRYPLQTECGHLFCKDCLEPIFRSSNSVCPVDKEPITREGTFPDNACRREVLQLLVFCKFRKSGCDWLGELKILETHIVSCRYRDIQCTQCGRLVPGIKFEVHQQKECPMRPSLCPHCNHKVPVEQLQAHVLKVCPKYLHVCPNKCDDNRKFYQSELQKHLAIIGGDCPLQIISCPYLPLGCDYESTREEMSAHLDEFKLYHSQLEVESILNVRTKVEHCMKSQKDIESLLTSLEHRVLIVEKKHSALELKVDVEETKRESKLESLHIKVNGLEDQVNKTSFGSPFMTTTSTQAPPPRFDHFLSKLTEIDHSVSRCLNYSMEFDLRLQLVERATYDGILLWKIDEVSQRRQEAIDGTTISLYSVPFYTSHQGYKMCARVYLNGDGIGKGTHLSLFFVVMKGNNDAILPWPFKQKVTLVLVNQSGKKNVVDQFRPDPQSSSFQRPLNREMNIASGCPTFCRLDQLKDGFIKDDCIFIGIIVDTSSMVKPIAP